MVSIQIEGKSYYVIGHDENRQVTIPSDKKVILQDVWVKM